MLIICSNMYRLLRDSVDKSRRIRSHSRQERLKQLIVTPRWIERHTTALPSMIGIDWRKTQTNNRLKAIDRAITHKWQSKSSEWTQLLRLIRRSERCPRVSRRLRSWTRCSLLVGAHFWRRELWRWMLRAKLATLCRSYDTGRRCRGRVETRAKRRIITKPLAKWLYFRRADRPRAELCTCRLRRVRCS